MDCCFAELERRLNQAALGLLEGADIQFKRQHRLDIALVKNLPMALVFLRAADIPTFVGEGRVDLGITGWDQVQEHDAGVRADSDSGSELKTANNLKDKAGSVKLLDLEFGYCN
jgi:ATP phosphoribosyltransferase